MADKDDLLGVVELDSSLAGMESGPHAVLWQITEIRMIVGMVEPDASLAGTESGPHDVPWQIRMIIWECSNPMLAVRQRELTSRNIFPS
jgi:hypothetical protein